MAPSLCSFYDAGYIDAVALPQLSIFKGAKLFAQNEGIVPAPESAHAIQAAINEALDAKEKGEKRVILFNLSGHGHFDLAAYNAFNSNSLEDYSYPDEAIKTIEERLPKVEF